MFVQLLRTDGTLASAQVNNWGLVDQPEQNRYDGPHGDRPTQVLTADQVIAILLAPGVTMG